MLKVLRSSLFATCYYSGMVKVRQTYSYRVATGPVAATTPL